MFLPKCPKKKKSAAWGAEISEEKDYSEHTAEAIDSEVSLLIKNASVVAEKILTEKRDTLQKLVAVLLEKETVEKEDFDKIVGIEKVQHEEAIEIK